MLDPGPISNDLMFFFKIPSRKTLLIPNSILESAIEAYLDEIGVIERMDYSFISDHRIYIRKTSSFV
jgi:hypothetical protein